METIQRALQAKIARLSTDVSEMSFETNDTHVLILLKDLFAGLNRAQEALNALSEDRHSMEKKAIESRNHMNAYSRYLILKQWVFPDDSTHAAS